MRARKCLPFLISTVCCLSILVVAGCGPDFDDFTELEDDPNQEPGPNNQEPNNTNNNDEDPTPSPPGGACDSQEDCESDLECRLGACLSECTDGNDCPDHSHCRQVGEESLCVPRCSDRGDCSHMDHGEDLSCVYLVQTERLGPSPHYLERACLPDTSDDGVFDGIDNCPDTINPDQSDRSGDGVGDACAAEPYCHGDAVEGELAYEPLSLRAGDWTIPAAIDGQWLPVVGTTDEDGDPHSPLWWLDRHTGQWHADDDLPFAGAHRTIFADNRSGFVISPSPDADAGAWSLVHPDHRLIGPAYPDHLVDNLFPPVPPLQFSNGAIHLPVTTDGSVLNWYRLTQDLNFFASGSSSGSVSLNLGISPAEMESAQSIQHPDGTVSMLFWSPDQRILAMADTYRPSTSPGTTTTFYQLTIPDTWSPSDDDNGENDNGEENNSGDTDELEESEGDDNGDDDAEDLSDFSPLAHAAPGGQLYVFDRHTGRAGRFVATRDDDHAHRRAWDGDFERLPEYDLPLIADLDDVQIYGLPNAHGMGVVGRDDAGDLQVHELYFHCHPIRDALDTAGDGVGDIIDNCPLHDNADQADLDQDSWGDVCDPDTDGDGIPDVDDREPVENDEGDDNNEDNGDSDEDFVDLSRDTTNDGIDNDDSDDIDGDGLSNQYDPFPLDSSNDGTPNRWTSDANANNYSDDRLRDLGLSPFRFSSTPTSARVAWITEGSSRHVYVGRIDAPEDAQPLDLDTDLSPHSLQFVDESTLLFLADAPGTTNRFLLYDLDDESIRLDQSFYPEDTDFPERLIRSVFMVDEDTFIVVHEDSEGQSWRVSQITPGDDLDTFDDEELFRGLPHVWNAALYDDTLVMLAAETDCRSCASLYEYELTSGSLAFVDEGIADIGHLSMERDHFSFIKLDDRDRPTTLRHVSHTSSFPMTVSILESAHAIKALSTSPVRNSSGTPLSSTRPTLAAVERFGEEPVLWLHQPWLSTPRQWQIFVAPDDPVVDIAWQP